MSRVVRTPQDGAAPTPMIATTVYPERLVVGDLGAAHVRRATIGTAGEAHRDSQPRLGPLIFKNLETGYQDKLCSSTQNP